MTHIVESCPLTRWSVSASLCWWCCCCQTDQLWLLIAHTKRRSDPTEYTQGRHKAREHVLLFPIWKCLHRSRWIDDWCKVGRALKSLSASRKSNLYMRQRSVAFTCELVPVTNSQSVKVGSKNTHAHTHTENYVTYLRKKGVQSFTENNTKKTEEEETRIWRRDTWNNMQNKQHK